MDELIFSIVIIRTNCEERFIQELSEFQCGANKSSHEILNTPQSVVSSIITVEAVRNDSNSDRMKHGDKK